jgi:predicted ABC-type transport system involved in lysophospholipase L1 biosynthesis ATPase subunit
MKTDAKATAADAAAAHAASLRSLSCDPEEVLFGWSHLDIIDCAGSAGPQSVLSGVSGYVINGGITAIVGASSSGKSVLLKVLAGRLEELNGIHVSAQETTLASRPLALDQPFLSHKLPVVYVPQDDDALIGVLTPREALSYAACMKNPGCTRLEKTRIVNDTLKLIGLDGEEADSYIGTFYKRGLSGGQKRRCTRTYSGPEEAERGEMEERSSRRDRTYLFQFYREKRPLTTQKEGESKADGERTFQDILIPDRERGARRGRAFREWIFYSCYCPRPSSSPPSPQQLFLCVYLMYPRSRVCVSRRKRTIYLESL